MYPLFETLFPLNNKSMAKAWSKVQTAVCSAAVLLFITASTAARVLRKRPHILVVVSDDQGYADFGYTGGIFPTPHLDAMAADPDTVRLTSFYVHPVCTPTRAALLTGRLAAKTGLVGPLLLAAPCSLEANETTLGEALQDRGYHTVLSGKWHLGHHTAGHCPSKQGFDEFYGVLNCCAAYYSKKYWHPLGPGIDWRRNEAAVAPPPPEHASEAFAAYMADSIARHAANATALAGDDAKPLFMLLTLTAPHSPLQPTPEHYARCAHVHTERRRLYCGLVASVDDALQRVKAALEDVGMWDDTLVWFFNDNGGNVWEGGRNYPYRGGKQSSYEGGSRAVSFVRLPPALLPRGGVPEVSRELHRLAHVSDVMPTLLSLVDGAAGVTARGKAAVGPDDDFWARGEGYDISDALLRTVRDDGDDGDHSTRGADVPVREDVLMQYDFEANKLGYRYGDWKLIAGVRGDGKLYDEPDSDSEWIGSGFNDMLCEILMSVNHWINEDASGSMDETVREIFQGVGKAYRQLWVFVTTGRISSWKGEELPALFDLSVDPHENNDLAAERPEVVADLLARVRRMEAGFEPSCDWMATDMNVQHEEVHWTDPASGEDRHALYHGPWVDEELWESGEYTPKPTLINIATVRLLTVWAIVFVEIGVVTAVMWLWWRRHKAAVMGKRSKQRRKKNK